MNKIIFHSNNTYNNQETIPELLSKKIPKWYSSAKFYLKKNNSEEYLLDNNNNKIPSFKSCPAILDSLMTGYFLTTPCDIEFYIDNGVSKVRTPRGFELFCGERGEINDFPVPNNFQNYHFHWYPNWGIETPKGYSALYLHPINRFDLPFFTVSGIIDSDKFDTPGLMPFFIKNSFEGIIPKGTPYMQIIPIKREEWHKEHLLHTEDEIIERNKKTEIDFRLNQIGAYKKKMWSKKEYY